MVAEVEAPKVPLTADERSEVSWSIMEAIWIKFEATRGNANESAKKDSSKVADINRRIAGAWTSHSSESKKNACSDGEEVKVVLIARFLRVQQRDN